MDSFLARYGSLVTWTPSGFDRLVFRGFLPPLVRDRGMHVFLARAAVRLLDFKQYVVKTSDRIKQVSLAEAHRLGRPVRYLDSPRISKEALARQLRSEQARAKPGLLCAFTAVEPCMSFEYHRSQNPEPRGLKLRPRKCLHIYQVHLHPTFGTAAAQDARRGDLGVPAPYGAVTGGV